MTHHPKKQIKPNCTDMSHDKTMDQNQDKQDKELTSYPDRKENRRINIWDLGQYKTSISKSGKSSQNL